MITDPTSATGDSPFGFPYTVDPGMVRNLVFAGDSLAVQAAGMTHYLRVMGGGPITKVGIVVVTSSGNVSLSAHRNTGTGRSATPGTQLATTGSIACPGTGYQEVSLGSSARLFPGDWIAVAADNTTAKFGSMLASVGDSNIGNGRQYRQNVFPAPATPASLTATVGYNFLLIGVA